MLTGRKSTTEMNVQRYQNRLQNATLAGKQQNWERIRAAAAFRNCSFIKLIVVILLISLIMFTPEGTEAKELSSLRSEGKSKMPVAEFIARVIDELGEGGNLYTDEEYVIRAIELKLIGKNTFKDYSAAISRLAAVKILVNADELLYGNTISNEDAEFVMENRISDIMQISSEKNRLIFSKGYALGYVEGSSDGDYSVTRSCTPLSKPYASTLIKMIDRLQNKKLRYSFSPDWQRLRHSDKGMPVNAAKYDYILESYPNLYYDSAFIGMDAKEGPGGEPRYIFWERMGDVDLEIRAAYELGNGMYNRFRFVWPNEISEVFSEEGRIKYGDNRPYVITDKFINEALEYYKTALNTDYRKIRTDSAWQEVMGKYLTESELEEYMTACERNETVLECDRVAADISSLYYSQGSFYCKVYVHMRVISDAGISDGDYKNSAQYGNMTPAFGGNYYTEGVDRGAFLYLRDDYQPGEWIDLIVAPEGYVDGRMDWDRFIFTVNSWELGLNGANLDYCTMLDYSGRYKCLLSGPLRYERVYGK